MSVVVEILTNDSEFIVSDGATPVVVSAPSYTQVVVEGKPASIAEVVFEGFIPTSQLIIDIPDGIITDANISDSAAIATSKLADGEKFLLSDGSVPMAGVLNMGANRLANLLTPTFSTDAANKAYVDSKAGSVVVHSQAIPEAVWSITHNLNKLYPFTTVVNSAGDEIFGGDVNPINENSLTISFGNAFGGIAYLQ